MRIENLNSRQIGTEIPNNSSTNRPTFTDGQLLVPNLDWGYYLGTFHSGIQELEQRLQIRLPMERRWIKFVNQLELKPETIEEAQLAVETFGEDILDTTIGDCTPLPGNVFRLRIACYPDTDDNLILSTISHEYGHTLSSSYIDPNIEELKAQTFEELFRHTQGFRHVPDRDDSPKLDKPHTTAKYYLQKLIKWGVKPEELLYFLVKSPFHKISKDRISTISQMLTHLDARRRTQGVNS